MDIRAAIGEYGAARQHWMTALYGRDGWGHDAPPIDAARERVESAARRLIGWAAAESASGRMIDAAPLESLVEALQEDSRCRTEWSAARREQCEREADQFAARLRALLEWEEATADHGEPLTLNQLAGYCKVSKRTLERSQAAGVIPPPDLPAAGPGRAHRWYWTAALKAALEGVAKRARPDRWGDHRHPPR